MPRRKITNWTMIREMCQNRYPRCSEQDVEVGATELARCFTKQEVGAFKCEGQAAEQVLEEVVKAAARQATQVAVHEIHHVAAKEDASAALCDIRHEAAMTMLESVAMGLPRSCASFATARPRHGRTLPTPQRRRHVWRMPPG
jgi:hypothetical protein